MPDETLRALQLNLENLVSRDQTGQDFLQAVQAAEARMQALHRPDSSGRLPLLSREDRDSLMRLHREIGLRAEKLYRTGADEATQKLAKRITALAAGNHRALLSYEADREPKTLPELLEEVRTLSLDSRGAGLPIRPGSRSSQSIRFLDGKGRECRGVFTPGTEQRSAAMSAAAELLGVPNLIARSRPMRIILPDGTQAAGSFNQSVKGLDPRNPDRRAESVGPDALRPHSPDERQALGMAQKALADLQVLNYLCGSGGSGRLLYSFTEANTLCGLQSVGNEDAFPAAPAREQTGLEDLKAVSASMAQAVSRLSPEALRFSLRGFGLTEQQLDGAAERLGSLQARLRADRSFFRDYDARNGPDAEPFPQGRLRVLQDRAWSDVDFSRLTAFHREPDGSGGLVSRPANLFAAAQDELTQLADPRRALQGPAPLPRREESLPAAPTAGSAFGAVQRGLGLLLLLLCLLAALIGCGREPAPGESAPAESRPVPVGTLPVTEPPATEPRLRIEPGPALRCNGEALGNCLLMDGAPMLDAALLTERGCGWETPEDRPDCLRLRLGERSLLLQADSPEAELDGAALRFSAPARREEGLWYLPPEGAEALGCVLQEAEGALALWIPGPGPELYFDGSRLGPCLLLNGLPCGELRALAEAAGAELEETEEGLRLIRGKRELRLRPWDTGMETAEGSVELPLPLLPRDGDWLIPVEPLAEALGLPRKEAENLVFSRIKKKSTLLWIDGREVPAYRLKKKSLYIDLKTLMPGAQTLPEQAEACLYLSAFGQELCLWPGSRRLLLNGEEQSLSAPVYAEEESWYAPAELLTLLGLTELEDPELDQIYFTHIVLHDELPEGFAVPVLMYHAVSDYVWGIPELFVSPSRLEQQLQALVERGFTPITFEDLDRIAEIQKPVMLTFDDGYDDNYTELFPLLQKYNVKATVFVIVNDLGKNHKLTRAQVKEMSDSGLVSIQSHTLSHNYLSSMYDAQLRREHYDSMLELARITGKQPFVLCYPTGKNSYYSRSFTAQYYQYGLCMTGPCYVTGDDPYLIYRYYIRRDTGLDSFLALLGEK